MRSINPLLPLAIPDGYILGGKDMHVEWKRCGEKLLAALRDERDALLVWSQADLPLDVAEGIKISLTKIDTALEAFGRASSLGGAADFMRKRFGKNWVLARRTARILERYGEDVRCVSPRKYAQCEDDYYNGEAP